MNQSIAKQFCKTIDYQIKAYVALCFIAPLRFMVDASGFFRAANMIGLFVLILQMTIYVLPAYALEKMRHLHKSFQVGYIFIWIAVGCILFNLFFSINFSVIRGISFFIMNFCMAYGFYQTVKVLSKISQSLVMRFKLTFILYPIVSIGFWIVQLLITLSSAKTLAVTIDTMDPWRMIAVYLCSLFGDIMFSVAILWSGNSLIKELPAK